MNPLKKMKNSFNNAFHKIPDSSKAIEKKNRTKRTNKGDNLDKILERKEEIRLKKAQDISFAKPILSQDSIEIIYPNTINVIQGQAGNHKSRLAAIICSAFIKSDDCQNELLDFKSHDHTEYTICYVDTERNLKDQFPFALQQIQVKAGYEKEDDPPELDYISLLEIKREERFEALDNYIQLIRQKFDTHIIIILDVLTDCLVNFNDPKVSLELVDMMNTCINEHDITFICVIHENPGSDKARGHLGTEIMNKASTVMQVGYDKGSEKFGSDIINVRYLKTRSTKRPSQLYLQYSEKQKTLVLMEKEKVESLNSEKSNKANVLEICRFLGEILSDPISQKDLVGILEKRFSCSDRTIRERLKKIEDNNMEIVTENGISYLRKVKNGNMAVYSLSAEKNEQLALN